jgi:hypothetical protein
LPISSTETAIIHIPHTSWAGIYQPFTYSTVCMRRKSVLTYGHIELIS